ncbi:MAG: PTS system mannose/fructose/sorbose family transporter subunit IID [Gemmatimonadaceae bacterium]
MTASAAIVTAPAPAPRLPLRTHVAMLLRLLAIQGAWNYETFLGNGIAFAMEPALRRLPGGPRGEAFKAAIARQSGYFNAHPYLAAIAVGALARAELDGEPSERIERFRTALAGPLGSLGDRLVWAAWLPFCSLLALLAFGLGAGTGTVLALFLGIYNAGHLWVRSWGLRTGWSYGLRVATALGTPLLRRGIPVIGRAAAFTAGAAFPLVLMRIIGPGRRLIEGVLVAAILGTLLLVRLHGRIDGWRLALIVLGVFALVAVMRR